MTDKKDEYTDEYQFEDINMVDSSPEEEEPTPATTKSASERFKLLEGENLKRNALIVIGGLIVLFVLYKIISGYFARPQAETPRPAIVTKVAPATPPKVVEPVNEVIPQLTTVEAKQEQLRSDLMAVQGQVGNLGANLTNLTEQVTKLNESIATLNSKMNEQAQDLEKAMRRLAAPPRPPIRKVIVRRAIPIIPYYIQAIIPGRAWLVGGNGSTLTVREGTLIPGYGTVKLVDPNLGRVLTSSGRIIRFSQEDS